MLCKSHDRGGVACTDKATWTVFWPGQTTESCDRHYQGQLRVAGAMGFALDARPIPPDPEDAGKGAPEDYPEARDKGA
jgi:hypothetical protein